MAAAWVAAGFRVAGALHRASRGAAARVAAVWLAPGFRLQSLLELRRTWPPLGPRLAFVWQAQCTEPPGKAAARVAAA